MQDFDHYEAIDEFMGCSGKVRQAVVWNRMVKTVLWPIKEVTLATTQRASKQVQ